MPMPQDLVNEYLEDVRDLRRAVRGMTNRQAQSRPIPNKWSTLEVLCHLADMEAVFAERMRRVMTEDQPALPGVDENLYVRILAYSNRQADEELKCVEMTRKQMARILLAQPEEAWKRVGLHSEDGEVSLKQLVLKAIKHLRHHLPFIEEKRRALDVD